MYENGSQSGLHSKQPGLWWGIGEIKKRQNFTELAFGTHLNVKLWDYQPVGAREQMSKSFPLLKTFFITKQSKRIPWECTAILVWVRASQQLQSWLEHSLPYSPSWGYTAVIINVPSLRILNFPVSFFKQKTKEKRSSSSPQQPAMHSSQTADIVRWWHGKAKSVPALSLIREISLITDKK